MGFVPSFLRFPIIFVNLATLKVKAHVMASDTDGTGTNMRIKYLVTWLGIVLEKPFVEGYGFLGGVDFISTPF